MITSAVLATMGGVKITPEELIGEESNAPGPLDDSPEARQMKFLQHLAHMEEIERKKFKEWMDGLGLAADE